MPDLPAWPYPRWIAHRGAGKLAPENTLAAFRLGARLGWTAYECDVKLSADGEPFLLHDSTLERTTSGQGPADALSWGALARLDAGAWHSPAHAGEAPPHLATIARHCLARGHAINLEIKPMPGVEGRTGAVVALAAQALWGAAVQAGHSPWPLLSSFAPDALAAAREAAPALPRALLLERLDADCWARALRLGCIAVVLDHRLIDGPALLAARHAEGLRVLAYTVNHADRARQLLDWGLDGVISDAVDQLGPATTAARG